MNAMNTFNFIDEDFPQAVGIVVTGSYLIRGHSVKSSDIDILVFDPIFSVVSSKTIFKDEKRFDITFIPLFNVENTFKNEQFDERGILLTMMASGKIIRDDAFGTIAIIQNLASILLEKGFYDHSTSLQATNHELKKLRGKFLQFTKEDNNSIFMLNEFFSLITTAELLKISRWKFRGRYKSVYLNEKNPKFLTILTSIFLDAINHRSKENFIKIADFIGTYQDQSTIIVDPTGHNEKSRVIIDLNYSGFNLNHFINIVLPLIRTNEHLGEKYLYFFLSPASCNHIFKYKISIVFKSSLVQDIVGYTRGIFKSLNIDFLHSTKPSFAGHLELMTKSNFDKCASEISLLCEKLVQTFNVFDGRRNLTISVIFTSFILSSLKLESDIYLLSLFLSSKRLFTSGEQRQLYSKAKMKELQSQKFSRFKKFSHDFQEMISAAFSKGKEIASLDHLPKDKIYSPALASISQLIDHASDNIDTLTQSNPITYSILKNNFNLNNPEKALVACIVFDFVNVLMCLTDEQISVGIFSYLEAYQRSTST
jgi:predicted nucleotidyltransferase